MKTARLLFFREFARMANVSIRTIRFYDKTKIF